MSDTSGNARLRIAVGMSGGVDSSAAAALLAEQGHDVIGITAHMWREGSKCCSLEDVARAIKVAEFLGIRHYAVDSFEFFGERVVGSFLSEYERGRTPSPCVRCNQLIKFGVLLRDALRMGATHVATGHYARIERRPDGFHLLKGRDPDKDQSYFLHRLFQEQLAHALFPLGGWTKQETIAYARKRGLPVVFDSESQDLCFVSDEGYAVFLEKHRPQLRKPGPIVDTKGRVLGEHDGFYRYTVGQREGLGIAARGRLYVKEVHAETNTVVVGAREEVTRGACVVDDVHWIRGSAPGGDLTCTVRLRYRHAGAGARARVLDNARAEIAFDEPQFAVTPGQAAVFYDGDEVLGGGWIASET